MGLSLFSDRNEFFNVLLNAAIPILVGILLMSIVNLDKKKEELSKSFTDILEFDLFIRGPYQQSLQ